MIQDELYRFSVRAARGSHRPVTIYFDWYTWRDQYIQGDTPTAEDCLQRFKYRPGGVEGLTFNIEELRYKNVPVAPGQPPPVAGVKHQEVVNGEATNWYEVEVPGCGPNGENMTERFILPVNGDGKIDNGHAIGWRKSGANLVAPDPDGEIYEIPGF
jgi:hypothetical protein